jgi:hypothetical protein
MTGEPIGSAGARLKGNSLGHSQDDSRRCSAKRKRSGFLSLCLTVIHIGCRRAVMNIIQAARPTVRLVAAMLVTVAVIGLSALAMHAPIQNQNSLARSLKSIQTDKATMFYANNSQDRCWFVERVLAGTSESKAATDNLKLVAATF